MGGFASVRLFSHCLQYWAQSLLVAAGLLRPPRLQCFLVWECCVVECVRDEQTHSICQVRVRQPVTPGILDEVQSTENPFILNRARNHHHSHRSKLDVLRAVLLESDGRCQPAPQPRGKANGLIILFFIQPLSQPTRLRSDCSPESFCLFFQQVKLRNGATSTS